MSAPDAIRHLLTPRRVAIIGASDDTTKTAGLPIKFLRKHGFAGEIWPVNPRMPAFDGLTCYPEVAALPGPPDVALVLLGAARTQGAVRALAERGTPVAIVLASGFGETGEDGARRQAELREAAGAMRLLGPNTIGLVNLTDGVPLSASSALELDHFPRGAVAVVSQSGGILGSLLSRAAARGLGLSKLVSTGNEVDLELADLVDYLADDAATKVIVLYIEAIRNADAFRRAVAKARTAGKPVVAYKVGRSDAGARSASSHTGAMASSDRLIDALFQQTGVIRAQVFSDLLDMPVALASGRSLAGRRVAILTSTGGAATLVSDGLGVAGFELPPPDAPTAEKLRALQTGDHSALDRNPIDVTLAGLQPKLLSGAIAALMASPSYDALVLIAGSSSVANPELMADAIATNLREGCKPVLAYVSPHAPQSAALLTARGVPAFTQPESIAAALSAMAASSSSVIPAAAGEPGLRDYNDVRGSSVPALVAARGGSSAGMTREEHRSLDEAEAKALFGRYGVQGVRERVVASVSEAEAAARELGPRVVLKILSREITHKTEVGGVAVGVTAEEIAARIARMRADVQVQTGRIPDRFLVQEMIAGGCEILLGLKRDPLGMALMVGMGGVAAELLGDTSVHLLAPGEAISARASLALLRRLKLWPLLDGYRGRPKCDVAALASAIAAFTRMAADLGSELIEAEINPLFVLPAGQGVRAADGVVVLA